MDNAAPLPGSQSQGVPADRDLADQRAGALARKQAVALRSQAPVRTAVARLFGVHTDERAWRIGADGEEMVAARLQKLAGKDSRWHFLHSVPVGSSGSDIDHVVIGPGGVYTLNAKHHPDAKIWVGGDTVMVNGQRQPYVRNSRFEAQRTSKLLSAACGFPVPAVGVVVPVGASEVTIKSPPRDVFVVNRRALDAWLRRRAEVLDSSTIEAVFDAARRPATWSQ
jgi:Nuclease-related domain